MLSHTCQYRGKLVSLGIGHLESDHRVPTINVPIRRPFYCEVERAQKWLYSDQYTPYNGTFTR